MSYEIRELSPIEKQISVLVPKEEVDTLIATIIGEKRESIAKKGFRKEKVPDSLIFKEQKAEILELARQQIINLRVREALQSYQIVPLNRIRVDSDTSLEKGRGFAFRFVAEVLPELELPDLKGLEIEVQKVVVSEEDIDWIIDSLREQFSTLEQINETRRAVDGEVVAFDFKSLGEFESVMGMSGSNHKLELGAPDTIRDFETILKSLKTGDTGTGTVTYPPEFPNPALAGKQVETQITLKALNRKILPAVDESFARKVARVNTIIEMRGILRQRHNHRLADLHRQDAQRRLLDKIIQKTEVPLSAGYVEQNLDAMIDNYAMMMQQRGMTMAEISSQLDEKRQQFLPEAESAARQKLLLLVIARQEQMELDQKELEAEIKRQAEAAETEPDQFMANAQQSGLIQHIKDNLIMKKAMDFLFDQATQIPVDHLQGP